MSEESISEMVKKEIREVNQRINNLEIKTMHDSKRIDDIGRESTRNSANLGKNKQYIFVIIRIIRNNVWILLALFLYTTLAFFDEQIAKYFESLFNNISYELAMLMITIIGVIFMGTTLYFVIRQFRDINRNNRN